VQNAVEVLDATRPALIVTYGNTSRKYRPLEGDLIVLGRGRACDIGLTSPEIAENHCVLYRTSGGWRLRDAGSRVGTRVNGKSVHDVPLCDEDVLQVGTFNFRVHLPEPGPAGPPAERERRLQRSRRGLARLALALRRRLHRERARRGSSPRPTRTWPGARRSWTGRRPSCASGSASASNGPAASRKSNAASPRTRRHCVRAWKRPSSRVHAARRRNGAPGRKPGGSICGAGSCPTSPDACGERSSGWRPPRPPRRAGTAR
jgi:pSer/pThr/pTyr-binding forkhead associated (FHA) protein